MKPETTLEMARRHVREGEEHIARQRELAQKLEQDGLDATEAWNLLRLFQSTLHEHRAHLNRLETDLGQRRDGT
jgi:hypothetical protein